MRQIKLDNHRGLPMYFIKERISGLDFKINFSHVENMSTGDELELGDFIFSISEIKENRLSPLDYGVDIPVYFHSTVSRIQRRIIKGDQNQPRKEVVVTEQDLPKQRPCKH
jgi:hypothetical protein